MPQEPMIKLEPGGSAPLLSYNVPEPTSYSGRHVIELELGEPVAEGAQPEEYFTSKARVGATPPATPVAPADPGHHPVIVVPFNRSLLDDAVRERPEPGFAAAVAAVAAASPGVQARTIIARNDPTLLKFADEEDARVKTQAGYRYARYRDMAGDPAARLLPPRPPEPRPRLLLVEVYRLSSYLGAYGAGWVLKTMTLLPGEKTKISIKTYMRRTTDAKEASSILDSFTKESADDFERSTSEEQSDKRSESENFEYHAEAEASASWGWGSAKVSGGVKGGTSSSREEFAKNVSNASQKHSAKASAKRDVQINTSYEVKEETGEETSIERTIENVNLSRTLNFVFRQMNQQFVTILHLVDVRIAFFNGYPASAREVPLSQLDSLLDEFVLPAKQDEVRDAILSQVRTVRDHEGNEHELVEEVDLGNGDKYLRIKKDLVLTYVEPVTGQEIEFTGIPMAIDKHTMRTDGIIVEALLGQADALDDYAKQLQELEVRRRTAEVTKLEAEAKRGELIVKICEDGNTDGAKLLANLLCPCGPATPATTPPNP